MSDLSLASSHSTQISLQEIRNGEAGLNAHRQSMLDRVPAIGDWAAFGHESLELKDLAYLTAKTGHEFAILRGKNVDILFHGTARNCSFDEPLAELLVNHKLTIVGHSHPSEDQPVPSNEDRDALRKIGQKRSTLISARTGITVDFGPDRFEILID